MVGRGALIADCSTQEFLDLAVTAGVVLRTPDSARVLALPRPGTRLASPGRSPVLREAGLGVQDDGRNGFLISGEGITTDRVGQLAAGVGAVISELSLRRASLEEAFMELTADSVEYSASATGRPSSTTSAGRRPGSTPDHELALTAAGK